MPDIIPYEIEFKVSTKVHYKFKNINALNAFHNFVIDIQNKTTIVF